MIGGRAFLELVVGMDDNGDIRGLGSVTLNGKKILASGWPDGFPPPLPELAEAVPGPAPIPQP